MCRSWSIKYSCSHICHFRLSTCRGTFTTQARPNKEPKAACSTSSVLVFHSVSKCGGCERAHVEKAMAKKVDDIRSKVALKSRARYEDELDFEEDIVPADNEELVAAVEEQSTMSFRVTTLYPDPALKKFRVPEKGSRMTSKPDSKLKHEVMPDDIVDAKIDTKSTTVTEEDNDYYNGWNSWTISNDRVVEIEQECKEWMESDSEFDETDSMTPEWGSGASEAESTTAWTSTKDSNETVDRVADTSSDQQVARKVKEPQPSDVAPTISTVLAESNNNKLSILPPTAATPMEMSDIDKENNPPSSIPASTIHTPPEQNKENVTPGVPYRTRAVPPHLRRRKSFIFNRQRSSSEPANGNERSTADLAEQMRCWNYSWVSVRN